MGQQLNLTLVLYTLICQNCLHLCVKVNKKLLRHHLSERTGKVVTLRDITNVQAGCREQSDKNNLEALVARLTAIDGKVFKYFKHIFEINALLSCRFYSGGFHR